MADFMELNTSGHSNEIGARAALPLIHEARQHLASCLHWPRVVQAKPVRMVERRRESVHTFNEVLRCGNRRNDFLNVAFHRVLEYSRFKLSHSPTFEEG